MTAECPAPAPCQFVQAAADADVWGVGAEVGAVALLLAQASLVVNGSAPLGSARGDIWKTGVEPLRSICSIFNILAATHSRCFPWESTRFPKAAVSFRPSSTLALTSVMPARFFSVLLAPSA